MSVWAYVDSRAKSRVRFFFLLLALVFRCCGGLVTEKRRILDFEESVRKGREKYTRDILWKEIGLKNVLLLLFLLW
jgi:hypothetical protein